MVLTVARLASSEQYKGHDVILRALPEVLLRVPELVYVVAGEGDDRPRLEALADSLGIKQNVIFTGQVSDSELAALYRRSDIFALPARTQIGRHEAKGEGFGIVFIEAMAFGKPVVGPDVGAPKEIIHHGRHGLLVNPEDSSAVASALIDLLMDPGKACAMGQAALDWVENRYSYTSFRESLRKLIGGGIVPGRQQNGMSNEAGESTAAKTLLGILFVAWVFCINLIYLFQYKPLAISRFAHFLHRWH